MAAQPSILWYDLETTGINWRWQRIVQFAAQRTDLELQPMDDPVQVQLDLTDDLLPDPGAVCVTGLGPRQLAGGGSEWDLLQRILPELTRPGTCLAGYNSLRFDDEFLRATLYRNFREPYAHEFQGGNSRWDLLDMVRTAAALRPDGLVWPTRDDGSPSFKLDQLAPANGISHGNAHDALADVQATIALAQKLHQAQPRLWAWYRRSSDKHHVRSLLADTLAAPLVHVSGRYPASQYCASLVASIGPLPGRANDWLVVDLRHDPAPLFALSPEQLRELLFTRRDQLPPDAPQVGLRTVRLNRCPSLSPAGVLDPAASERLGLDLAQCHEHLAALRAQGPGLTKHLAAVFQRDHDSGARQDPDAALYDGFIDGADKRLCQQVASADGPALRGLQPAFQDWRLEPLLQRYRGRNFAADMAEAEQLAWRGHVVQRLAGELPGVPSLADHCADIRAMAATANADQQLLLQDLRQRADSLAARYGINGLPAAAAGPEPGVA